MTEENRTYPVTYDIGYHSPPLTADQVPDGAGACDLLLTLAAQVNGDETLFASQSISGRTGQPLDAAEIFDVWQGLTRQLARQLPEGTGPQVLCQEIVDILERAGQAAGQAATAESDD